MRRSWAVAVIAVVLPVVSVAACSDGKPPAPTDPSSAPVSPSPSPSPSPSASPSPSPSPSPGVTELVVPPVSDSLPATWHEVFVVPYGATPETLGTSPGGDSGTLDIGPEYGAQGTGGDWWFLDAAKRRLAHYDAAGAYLGEVRIPKRLLVGRTYFQWQLPFVMGDNTLVAVRHDPAGANLLREHDGDLDEIPVEGGDFSPTYATDRLLYGFGPDGGLVAVDPDDGAMTTTTTLITADGMPFSITMDVDKGKLRVELPQAGVTRSLPIRTTSGARAHVGLQVRAGADDVVHLFMTGSGEDDESVQLVGYASITPDGTVSPVEALPNPFSEADPGSPAQLVMAPGSSTPRLVYVLPDGVHVYERAG